jgi:hypothetical protein
VRVTVEDGHGRIAADQHARHGWRARELGALVGVELLLERHARVRRNASLAGGGTVDDRHLCNHCGQPAVGCAEHDRVTAGVSGAPDTDAAGDRVQRLFLDAAEALGHWVLEPAGERDAAFGRDLHVSAVDHHLSPSWDGIPSHRANFDVVGPQQPTVARPHLQRGNWFAVTRVDKAEPLLAVAEQVVLAELA